MTAAVDNAISGGRAPSASWGGNLGAIVNFFQGKGLNNYAIAGILGNLKVESSDSTSAYNANEGAIGLAQWEGGRRTALQQYAAAHGLSETDLNAQLGFMWHELTTSESGVLDQLRNVRSASDAATIWDSQYERSAGTTRSQRIANANAYFSNGFQSIGGETAGSAAGYGGTDASGSAAGPGTTADEYKLTDGLRALFGSVPELQHLINQATANNWTTAKFQNAVENSTWYKTHSDTARSVLTEQANDPATYHQNLATAQQSIQHLARQLGVPLGDGRLQNIAAYALLTGNDKNQQWLTDQLFYGRDWSHVDPNSLSGGMAQTAQQINQLSADYGYKWTPAQVSSYAQQVLQGNITIDTLKQLQLGWAKSAFPSLAHELDSGQTVKDLATPYMQSMSNLLEVDPGTLSVYTPAIRKALQGATDPTTKQRTTTPLWQFEDQVRQDPRWQTTQNAKDTVSTALVKIGHDFGFGF